MKATPLILADVGAALAIPWRRPCGPPHDRPSALLPRGGQHPPLGGLPFSYIEIHLDASGKGEGKLIAAAQVSLEGSTVEIKSLGVQPFKLMDVHSSR